MKEFFFYRSDHYQYTSLYCVILSCKKKKGKKRNEINYTIYPFKRKVIWKWQVSWVGHIGCIHTSEYLIPLHKLIWPPNVKLRIIFPDRSCKPLSSSPSSGYAHARVKSHSSIQPLALGLLFTLMEITFPRHHAEIWNTGWKVTLQL